jgi:hypothetical protein
MQSEALRLKGLLAEDLKKTQYAHLVIQSSEAPRSRGSGSDRAARWFKARTDGLNVPEVYPLYRVLSSVAHPTADLVDVYLDEPPTGDRARFSLRPGLAALPVELAGAATHLVACCLVWTARAVDHLDRHNLRRGELRAYAQELGIKADPKS